MMKLVIIFSVLVGMHASTYAQDANLRENVVGKWACVSYKKKSGYFTTKDKKKIWISPCAKSGWEITPVYMLQNGGTGEQLSYEIRPDSTLIIVNKYYYKIMKITRDSLVYRDYGFNLNPKQIGDLHNLEYRQYYYIRIYPSAAKRIAVKPGY